MHGKRFIRVDLIRYGKPYHGIRHGKPYQILWNKIYAWKTLSNIMDQNLCMDKPYEILWKKIYAWINLMKYCEQYLCMDKPYKYCETISMRG